MGGSRGGAGQGVQTSAPLKIKTNIGFSSNTGPDPLKNRKATKPAFNVGQSPARQITPFKFRWRVDNGPLLMLVFVLILFPIQKKEEKNV